MKKIKIIILVFSIMLPLNVKALDSNKLIPNATSGLLMEQSTGNIIFEKEKDKKVAVASMTKMVAQILILEKNNKP